MVINCIALETVAETLACLKKLPVKETEILQLAVSKAKTVGAYHMMMEMCIRDRAGTDRRRKSGETSGHHAENCE